MTGDAARSDDYDRPARWCLWCYGPIRLVAAEWRHVPEQGPPVVACRPLDPASPVAAPAPEGMRLVHRHRMQ